MILQSSRVANSLDRHTTRVPSQDNANLMVEALSRALAARDGSTHEHSQRVQRYALALAREIGITDALTSDAIWNGALLHDIGKLGIPDDLLRKPGPLTKEEYDQVKQHVVIGADILSAVSFPTPLALIVRHHHENWDGTGYPDGLRGEGIPLGARVLAIVDCYDALISDRPYRRALSHGCAVAMIHDGRSSLYDATIVDAFLGIVQRLRSGSAKEAGGRPQTRVSSRWLHARAV